MQAWQSLIEDSKTRSARTRVPGDDIKARLFVERLRRDAKRHDHERHPFHWRLLEGKLCSEEIQLWVVNTYYYETRIPITDALILAKSDDSAFRRRWLRRIVEQDGESAGEGNIALWQRLAEAVGVDKRSLEEPSLVLSGVRFACDAYVNHIREASLCEAIAASLADMLLPEAMERRLAALQCHYPWIDSRALDCFRVRIQRARREADEMLAYLTEHVATTRDEDACARSLVHHSLTLWHILDCIDAASRASAKSA